MTEVTAQTRNWNLFIVCLSHIDVFNALVLWNTLILSRLFFSQPVCLLSLIRPSPSIITMWRLSQINKPHGLLTFSITTQEQDCARTHWLTVVVLASITGKSWLQWGKVNIIGKSWLRLGMVDITGKSWLQRQMVDITGKSQLQQGMVDITGKSQLQ